MKHWGYSIVFLAVSTIMALASASFAVPPNTTSAQQTSTAQRVLKAADSSVGKKMWFGYGLPNGTLGCAAALSNVLKAAGITRGRSATVVVVRRQLLTGCKGVQEIEIKSQKGDIDDTRLAKLARPGDILMAYMAPPPSLNGGPNAHCGIIGEGGTVYTNDWNDGIWKHTDIHTYFDFYPYIRVIRLP